MLKQRIITALILAPVAIACVFLLPPLQFSIFVGLVLSVAAWEWANLAGFAGIHRYLYSGAIVVLLAGSVFLPPLVVLVAGCLWWCVSFVLIVRYPQSRDLWSSRAALTLLGILVLVPAFIGLRVLKTMPESGFLILLLFLLIWGADIGAYFAGRAFGRARLAPAVSPGKSWAGFYGGLATAMVIAAGGALWQGIEPMSARGAVFFLGCAFVVVISVIGDLAESMFKRNRGIKDSSNLLPGHGGFLDRIDSLLSAGPVFCLFILLFQQARP